MVLQVFDVRALLRFHLLEPGPRVFQLAVEFRFGVDQLSQSLLQILLGKPRVFGDTLDLFVQCRLSPCRDISP